MNDVLSFDQQPKLLSPEQAADLIHTSRATVYDWKYRPYKYEIPEDLFMKFGRKLFIRTDVLKTWFYSRSA